MCLLSLEAFIAAAHEGLHPQAGQARTARRLRYLGDLGGKPESRIICWRIWPSERQGLAGVRRGRLSAGRQGAGARGAVVPAAPARETPTARCDGAAVRSPTVGWRCHSTSGSGGRGMSRALLKLSGGRFTRNHRRRLPEAQPRVAPRRAATRAGISLHPFTRRNPFAASSTPAATQRSTIVPPRQRFTFRFTWRVRLSRLSMASWWRAIVGGAPTAPGRARSGCRRVLPARWRLHSGSRCPSDARGPAADASPS